MHSWRILLDMSNKGNRDGNKDKLVVAFVFAQDMVVGYDLRWNL